MTLDEKLYKLRTDKGITQAKLADHLNVTRQTVSKWETGETIPSTDNLKRISSYYSVPLDYLVKTDSEPDAIRTEQIQPMPDQSQNTNSGEEYNLPSEFEYEKKALRPKSGLCPLSL